MALDDKNIGIYDVDDTTELDDCAYMIYANSVDMLWGHIAGHNDPIPQSIFMRDRKHLMCFYRIAISELRIRKLRRIKSEILK